MKRIIAGCWWIIAAHLVQPERVAAQSITDSLLLAGRGSYGSAWSMTGNPVWLNDNSIPDFAEAGIYYHGRHGDFLRPQEPLRIGNTGFGAQGIKRYRNWRFQGAFSYEKLIQDSLNYTYSARPFNGNPFMVADLQGGDWKGDHLLAGVQLLAPGIGKWTIGLGVDYEAEQNARNNDPRPLNRYINYQIRPAIAYQFDKSNQLSFTTSIEGSQEIVEIGLFSSNNPLLYTLRGYGYATASPVVTAERLTSGNAVEAGVDYRHQALQRSFLLSARYKARQEDVSDGYSKTFIGGLDEQSFSVTGRMESKHKDGGWLLMGQGWIRNGTGYDESQKSVNPSYYLSGFNGKFSYWKRRMNQDLVIVELLPSLRHMNYAEQIAETDWTSLLGSSIFRLNYKRQWLPGLFITASPMIGYTHNLSGALQIAAPQLMSEILTRPDFNYFTTDFFTAGFSALADLRIGSTTYRFGGGYTTDIVTAKDTKKMNFYTNRNNINITCTLLF